MLTIKLLLVAVSQPRHLVCIDMRCHVPISLEQTLLITNFGFISARVTNSLCSYLCLHSCHLLVHYLLPSSLHRLLSQQQECSVCLHVERKSRRLFQAHLQSLLHRPAAATLKTVTHLSTTLRPPNRLPTRLLRSRLLHLRLRLRHSSLLHRHPCKQLAGSPFPSPVSCRTTTTPARSTSFALRAPAAEAVKSSTSSSTPSCPLCTVLAAAATILGSSSTRPSASPSARTAFASTTTATLSFASITTLIFALSRT